MDSRDRRFVVLTVIQFSKYCLSAQSIAYKVNSAGASNISLIAHRLSLAGQHFIRSCKLLELISERSIKSQSELYTAVISVCLGLSFS